MSILVPSASLFDSFKLFRENLNIRYFFFILNLFNTRFLEKVTQLEERNFVLQTDKEEKESQLEELSRTNQNLQSEIKELKDAMSQMGNETDPNSNGIHSLFIF